MYCGCIKDTLGNTKYYPKSLCNIILKLQGEAETASPTGLAIE